MVVVLVVMVVCVVVFDGSRYGSDVDLWCVIDGVYCYGGASGCCCNYSCGGRFYVTQNVIFQDVVDIILLYPYSLDVCRHVQKLFCSCNTLINIYAITIVREQLFNCYYYISSIVPFERSTSSIN